MSHALIDPVVSAKVGVVRGEDDAVLARPVGADAVVRVGLGRVKVEDEEEVPAFEDDDLVRLGEGVRA